MERFSALVLSHDTDAVRVINKALEEYGLEAKIARSVRDANELLKERKYDLAVCDYDLPGTGQFAYLEPNSHWRGMVFALVGRNQVSEIRGQRVHLTLPKPLSPGVFSKGLKAAYSTMAHERRASLRHPVGVQASMAEMADKGERHTIPGAKVLNISHTGMCLETKPMLPQHASLRMTFDLPEYGGVVEVAGTVMWAKATGQSGIKFTSVSAVSQKRLDDWLDAKGPKEFTAV
ncbi:MAG TPA: response regulator [Candidatus Angelobacter sp.]